MFDDYYNVFEECQEVEESSYTCPWCGAYAGMGKNMYRLKERRCKYYIVPEMAESGNPDIYTMDKFCVVTCRACGKIQFWFNGDMIYPLSSSIQEPNQDMPKDVKDLYNEARSVFELSPKAGAALLRLALQKLCIHLKCKGNSINDDICQLVKKGLSVQVQQAFDCIRVIGNNGVHPGEINLDEDKEMAVALFPIMNMIVDRMISEPKRIESIYKNLPKGARQAIEKRDGEIK